MTNLSVKIKKTIASILAVTALSAAMSGCSVAVGDDAKNNNTYDQIFSDATEANLTSFVKYRFKLDGDYGEMEVSVDTSNGHSFELSEENTGFNILDKDGNVVIYAACVDRYSYSDMISNITATKIVNGREFFAETRGNDRNIYTMYSYMADCGLDCGLVLETHTEDEDVFKLIAFGGEALDGASSDPNAYKNAAGMTEVSNSVSDVTETTESEVFMTSLPENSDTEANANADSDMFANMLAELPSDYNKINWGVVYNISEDYPGLYVSITPYTSFGSHYLIVAYTSLYEDNISISADATALTSDGATAGDRFVFVDSISRGMTVIDKIYCGENEPDGRIHWENISIKLNESDKVLDWEADTTVNGAPSEGMVTVDYTISTPSATAMNVGTVSFILTDENGFVVGMGEDVAVDATKNGESYTSSCDIYEDSDALSRAANILMFAVPTAAE